MHVHMTGGVTVEMLFVEETVERLMVCEDISSTHFQLTVNVISL
jgi:hypothetical protein